MAPHAYQLEANELVLDEGFAEGLAGQGVLEGELIAQPGLPTGRYACTSPHTKTGEGVRVRRGRAECKTSMDRQESRGRGGEQVAANVHEEATKSTSAFLLAR